MRRTHDRRPQGTSVLFHYTDRVAAEEILRQRVLRAHSTTVHGYHPRRDERVETPPLVWLTTNAYLEGSVVQKMMQNAGRQSIVNDICRFILRPDPTALTLRRYAKSVNIPLRFFSWMMAFANELGPGCKLWRCCPRDIPIEDWRGVEILTGRRANGNPIWTPYVHANTPFRPTEPCKRIASGEAWPDCDSPSSSRVLH